MAIEQEVRSYVRVTGTGQPEIVNATTTPLPTPTPNASYQPRTNYPPQSQHQWDNLINADEPPLPPPTQLPSDPSNNMQRIIDQTEANIPNDTILTRNAIDFLGQQGYTQQGGVYENRTIPYGTFTVRLQSGNVITPKSYDDLVSKMVDEQKYQYRSQGSYYGLQGYTPQVTDTGDMVYIKQESQASAILRSMETSGYMPQSGDVQQSPGGPIINVPEKDFWSGISKSFYETLGFNKVIAQEPWVMPDMFGNPNLRQQMLDSGLAEQGVSQRDLNKVFLQMLQVPAYVSGFGAIPRIISTPLGLGLGAKAVKDIAEEKNAQKQLLDASVLAGSIFLGAGLSKGIKGKPVDIGDLFREKFPQQTEVTYVKNTGDVYLRNYWDVFGVKIKSPLYDHATGTKGFEFFKPKGFDAEGNPITPEPLGLAQASWWKPTKQSAEISVVNVYSKKIVSPVTFFWKQPKKGGISEPYVKTGMEVGFLNPKPILRPETKLTVFDPIFSAYDPRIKEIDDTLGMLSKNWQPKTGIPFPKEIVKDSIEPSKTPRNPFDVFFKQKEPKKVTTLLWVNQKGELMTTKYGVTEKLEDLNMYGPTKKIIPKENPLEVFFKPKKPEPVVSKLGVDEIGEMFAEKYGIKQKLEELNMYGPTKKIHLKENPLEVFIKKKPSEPKPVDIFVDDLGNLRVKKYGVEENLTDLNMYGPTKKINLKENPFEVFFKQKEPEPVTTKLEVGGVSGRVVGTRYGLSEYVDTDWQPIVGMVNKSFRTGHELWTTVFPKPVEWIPPGKLMVIEEQLPLFGIILESGKAHAVEDLFKVKKPITMKDLFKMEKITPDEPGTTTKGGDGQETVLIMEEPTVEQTDYVVRETLAKVKEQNAFKEWSVSEEKTKDDVSSLFIFPPMLTTKQETEQKQQQDVISVFDSMQKSLEMSMNIQLQGSMQKQGSQSVQATISDIFLGDVTQRPRFILEDLISNPNKTPDPIKNKIKEFFDDLDDEVTEHSFDNNAFIVKLRGRQWVNGKKVGSSEYRKSSGPLSFDDAMSSAMNIVGNNEKASFQIEPVNEKPHALRKHVPDWTNELYKYHQKDEKTWVEDSQYRIDSVGEKMAITMKGIKARMK